MLSPLVLWMGAALAAPELRGSFDATVVLLPHERAEVVALGPTASGAALVLREGTTWRLLRFEGPRTVASDTWTHPAPGGVPVTVDAAGRVWVGEGDAAVALGAPDALAPRPVAAPEVARADGRLRLGEAEVDDPCPGAPAATAELADGPLAAILCPDGPVLASSLGRRVGLAPLPELAPPDGALGVQAWSDPEGVSLVAWGEGALQAVRLEAGSGVPWRWSGAWVPGGATVQVPKPTLAEGEVSSAVASQVRTGVLTAREGLTVQGRHLYLVGRQEGGQRVLLVAAWRP
ncbi:MAG: hypothetical protein H6732_07455 [Alphaproteobacteria bacterium]|nr:hypothetical protein [Alphaproteobacteria bacterium]